jgi:PHD/YefM family antitoxin component YafN of YafNO toxin-antitoxin module
MKVSDVRSGLNKLVNAVHRNETRVLVEKSGIPVAGLVTPENLDLLADLDVNLAERRRVLEAMRASFREVPGEEIEHETDRIIKKMREEDQQTR